MIGVETPEAIIITDASGPGPSAVHRSHSIQFDVAYCMKKVRTLLRRGKHYKYIGDWHSHPFSELIPSLTDYKSFSLKSLTHFRTSHPVMIITGPPPLVTLQAFLLHRSVAKVPLELVDKATVMKLLRKAI